MLEYGKTFGLYLGIFKRLHFAAAIVSLPLRTN